MALELGSRLGHYAVDALIGEGGMGQVYSATDTKLNRQVALKILPGAFASDPDRLARFQREAQVLASLNHPGIATIHGIEESDGQQALVLELVEGPTLADRIAKGPIPLDEALPIAKQIAEALEAAHEAGVIHRDLKPANIKVRDDGTVKVLDFGLAKALDPTPGGDASQSPTLTAAATQHGVIIGTAAYMSPEQAVGRVADKRSDIWAFSVVLFEMLTGQRLFSGETVSHVLASVLKTDPNWTSLPADTPEAIRRLLRRGLERERKRRLGDITDALLEIEEVQAAPAPVATAPQPTPAPHGWRQGLPMATSALVLGSLITGLAVWTVTQPTPPEIVRLQMTLPTRPPDMAQPNVAMSPGGDLLAFVGSDGLFLRRMDQLDATPVNGSEGARAPFFSPEGQWVGFHADDRLMKVAVTGGAPVALCDTTSPFINGAHWTQDGVIYFSAFQEGIWRVSANGGTPELVVPVGEANSFFSPRLLPGGEWLLLSAVVPGPLQQVVVHSLTTGHQEVLVAQGGNGTYLPTGHLTYALDGTLLVVPFDAGQRTVTGGPVPLAEGLAQSNITANTQFFVAEDGTLAYMTGESDALGHTLVWVDRDGREEPIDMPPRRYGVPNLSPDGRRLAVDTWFGEEELYLYNFETSVEDRFTFDPSLDRHPLWSPDGSQIVFVSNREPTNGLYVKAADGSGSVRRIASFDFPVSPMDWTDDGQTVLFGGSDIMAVPVNGDEEFETLLETEFNEALFRVSPNGRWIAYMSDAAGSRQVWVRPFPDVGGGQRLVSDGPGEDPLWGPDGRELFYMTADAAMVVPVETGETFVRGTPERMFSMAPYLEGIDTNWAVAPDGQRFVMVKRDPTFETRGESVVTIVQNWHEELKRLVPVD